MALHANMVVVKKPLLKENTKYGEMERVGRQPNAGEINCPKYPYVTSVYNGRSYHFEVHGGTIIGCECIQFLL